MLVVGLTGGIGSGKSAACQIFSSLDVPVIDTDEIARSLTQVGSPALELIRKAFGDNFFQPDGALDRASLRQRIFSIPEDKLSLERILHPLIRQEAVRQLASLKSNEHGCQPSQNMKRLPAKPVSLSPCSLPEGGRDAGSLREFHSNYAIIAVPLLLETGAYNGLIQRVLLIDCPEQQQIERVMKRSAISEAEVKAIMSKQAGRQARIKAADEIIVNDGTVAALELKVLEIHRAYLKLSASQAS